MLVVLDTNVLVASLSASSPEHWVIQRLLHDDFHLCISHEILMEYEEVLTVKYGTEITRDFLQALEFLPNVKRIDVYFHWNLLDDPDDNKFVDSAVASGAKYIVSEDRHFRKLKNIHFPKITLLRLSEFKSLF